MKRGTPSAGTDASSRKFELTFRVVLEVVVKPISLSAIASVLLLSSYQAFAAYQNHKIQKQFCPEIIRSALKHQGYSTEPINRLFWEENPKYDGMEFSQGIPKSKLDEWHSAKKRINDCKAALKSGSSATNLFGFKLQLPQSR
jgi:hypothetical protein